MNFNSLQNSPQDAIAAIERIEAQAAAFSRSIAREAMVLYAGMNLPSPRASALLSLPLGAMPAMGQGQLREQPGVQAIAGIEAETEALACALFRGHWAEVRLQSCTLANLAVFAAICRPGDRIAITPASAGGHVSHQSRGAPSVAGLKTIELPFSVADQCVDDLASAAVIRAQRPRLVMLGASYVPGDFDFSNIVAAAREVDALVCYDIAHVAGLVAGGVFANPLDQGADLITASTYKSLAGPPGGLIIGTDRIADVQACVRRAAFPQMTANYDAARVAALGVSLGEALQHSAAYAQACLANARSFHQALERRGISAVSSRTHHVVIPIHDADACAHALVECGVICGSIAVAGQAWPRGLRIGTQYLTRRGFMQADMEPIAALFARALNLVRPAQGSSKSEMPPDDVVARPDHIEETLRVKRADAPWDTAEKLHAEIAAFMRSRHSLSYWAS